MENNFSYWCKNLIQILQKTLLYTVWNSLVFIISCTLVAVLLLMDRSTYKLFRVMEMFLTVTKRSKFVWNGWVNPLLTFICNRMQGKYTGSPYKLQQVANHSYAFSYEKLFELYILWTVHHDTQTRESPTRFTLFLNYLYELNFPLHVSNK